MDWQAGIERHGSALKRVVSSLVAMVGAGPAAAGDRPTLSRRRHRALLRLLAPAAAPALRKRRPPPLSGGHRNRVDKSGSAAQAGATQPGDEQMQSGTIGAGRIRAGMGGWTFEPWEGSFYPADLPRKRQLEYAARQVKTIEVNGTYYSGFKPETYAKWAAETPDDFVFAIKGNRFVTNRKVLSSAGESMQKFFAQGLELLGGKLGPIVWQFAPTKTFEPEDFEGFLALLPKRHAGLALRHVLEVRHASFVDPAFVALARSRGMAICHAHHRAYPEIADVTADFVYSRLQKGQDDVPTAYPEAELDAWTQRLRIWAAGGVPDDLPRADPSATVEKTPRDVFVYIIHEGKIRAPQGAMALQRRLDG